MQKVTSANTVSKKKSIVVLTVVVLLALIAVSAGVAGHTVYLKNRQAEIIGYSSSVSASDSGYVYYYASGIKSVKLSDVLQVSDGASLNVVKIKDEDGTVNKPDGDTIDLSYKAQRTALINVVSKSGAVTNDYSVTVTPESAKSNVISYDLGTGTLGAEDKVTNYSGATEVSLPTPVKVYRDEELSQDINFEFQGWFTDPSYSEESKIESIPAGSEGEIKLYAKFADSVIHKNKRTQFTYVYFGSYPQSQVPFNKLNAIKQSSEYQALNGQTEAYFTYEGQRYYKYIPKSVPNLAENGFSSNNSYIFSVEPVKWRVLTPPGADLVNGNAYTLLSERILNCESYSTGSGLLDGLIEKKYNEIMDQYGSDGLDGIEKHLFGSDALYSRSTVKEKVDSMFDEIFSNADKNYIIQRTDFKDYNWVGSESNYSCSMWLLNFSEATSAAYGFNPDFMLNDANRRAYASDYAAANGVYRSTAKAHTNRGSWWLRGAGDTHSYSEKRISYVKYTGYVHAYGAINYNVRSGIRPSVNFIYNRTYFGDITEE